MTSAGNVQTSTRPEWNALVADGWDFVQGAFCGAVSHYMMESCEEMHRNNPESLVPYAMPLIYFIGGGALEVYYQSKIGKTAAAFFGSWVAMQMPVYGFQGRDVQFIAAALTGGGIKRVADSIKGF